MRNDPAAHPGGTQRTVLVTGGSRGIGAAASRLAAAAGWAVAVNYTRDAAAADAVVAAIVRGGGRALAVRADVAVDAEVRAMFAAIDAALPPLAGLVNNAGVVDTAARVDAMTVERLQRMFAINVFGSFYCAREAIVRMTTTARARRHAGRARGRRDRQRLVGGGQARRQRPVRRLRCRQGCDRVVHDRPRQGSRRRRHPRQRGAAGDHRDRDPRLGRRARPRRADGAAGADAPRRNGRRGRRSDRLAALRCGELHDGLDARSHRRPLTRIAPGVGLRPRGAAERRSRARPPAAPSASRTSGGRSGNRRGRCGGARGARPSRGSRNRRP